MLRMAGWQLSTGKMQEILHKPAFQTVSPPLSTALHLPFQAAIVSCVWPDLGSRSCWLRIIPAGPCVSALAFQQQSLGFLGATWLSAILHRCHHAFQLPCVQSLAEFLGLRQSFLDRPALKHGHHPLRSCYSQHMQLCCQNEKLHQTYHIYDIHSS